MIKLCIYVHNRTNNINISNDAGKDDDFFGDDGGDHNDQA